MSPRQVAITVYSFDELSGDAKATAGQAIVKAMQANGHFRGMLHAIAADWLTNEGWTGLADLRWEDNADPTLLQFSISEDETDIRGKGRNRDFVVWTSTRPMRYQRVGQMIRVETKIYGAWEPGMDVRLNPDDTAGWSQDHRARAMTEARAMVGDHRVRLLDVLRTAGHDAEADTEFLADYATQQSMDFTADGKVYVG